MTMTRVKTTFIVAGVSLLLFAFIVGRSFLFDLLVISGHSMEPAITQGSRVIVDKTAYRSHKPQWGDVVVFRIGIRKLVKRIVGLPGDVIEIKGGSIFRNGREVDRIDYVASRSHTSTRRRSSLKSIRIRERHVFVAGDNRDMSMDSRNFGLIPYRDIIGKVVFIYFPPGQFGKLE